VSRWDCTCASVEGQGFDLGDELAALAAVHRRGHGSLDPELVGLVGLALADALPLRSVQEIDLLALWRWR
jgi:hypothetical protein